MRQARPALEVAVAPACGDRQTSAGPYLTPLSGHEAEVDLVGSILVGAHERGRNFEAHPSFDRRGRAPCQNNHLFGC